MNAPQRIDLRTIAPQPWKNGAGLTRDVRCARRAADLPAADVTLLLCSAGRWQVSADAPSALGPMQALLWCAPVASLHVEPLGDDDAALLAVRLCHDRRR